VLVVLSSGIFDRIEIYKPLEDIVDDDGRRGQGSGGDGLPAADTEPDAGVPPLVELCGSAALRAGRSSSIGST
jgi:hypothetical protein